MKDHIKEPTAREAFMVEEKLHSEFYEKVRIRTTSSAAKMAET